MSRDVLSADGRVDLIPQPFIVDILIFFIRESSVATQFFWPFNLFIHKFFQSRKKIKKKFSFCAKFLIKFPQVRQTSCTSKMLIFMLWINFPAAERIYEWNDARKVVIVGVMRMNAEIFSRFSFPFSES